MIEVTAWASVSAGGVNLISIQETQKFDVGEGANEYTEKLLKWVSEFPHPGESYPPIPEETKLMGILDRAGI